MVPTLYTSFFTDLRGSLNNQLQRKPEVPTQTSSPAVEKSLNEELREILEPIKTLKDYAVLIDILSQLKDSITVRFIDIFFEELVVVEERIWLNEKSLTPPMRELYEANEDLLLDSYEDFVCNYEQGLIDWFNSLDGWRDIPENEEFLVERHRIYTDYVLIAHEVLNAY